MVLAAEMPVPMPDSAMAPPVAALAAPVPPPSVASAAAVVLRGSNNGEVYLRKG
jgi:hypothetical protein